MSKTLDKMIEEYGTTMNLKDLALMLGLQESTVKNRISSPKSSHYRRLRNAMLPTGMSIFSTEKVCKAIFEGDAHKQEEINYES